MKKITAILLIISLATTAIITQFGQWYGAHANAIEYWVGWDGPDLYAYCYHTNLGELDNMCVGIGMQAHYHKPYPGHYDYCEANWTFNSNCGAYGDKAWWIGFWPEENYNIFECDPWWEINDMMYEAGYYGPNEPFWCGGPPALNMSTQRSYYPSPNSYKSFSPHASMVTGHVGQYFYWYGYVLYLEITVDPWYALTAQADRQHYNWTW